MSDEDTPVVLRPDQVGVQLKLSPLLLSAIAIEVWNIEGPAAWVIWAVVALYYVGTISLLRQQKRITLNAYFEGIVQTAKK